MKIEINIEDAETKKALSNLAARHDVSIEQVTEKVIVDAVGNQKTRFKALKSHIDKAYAKGGFNSDQDVSDFLESKWD